MSEVRIPSVLGPALRQRQQIFRETLRLLSNPLNSQIPLINMQKFSSHLTENTPHLHYLNRPINAVVYEGSYFKVYCLPGYHAV
jgi:hypothetical protein